VEREKDWGEKVARGSQEREKRGEIIQIGVRPVKND